MTTFARKTFDAAAYLRYRPTYSDGFIKHVIQYARPPASSAKALDLGCGPGQATALLGASGVFERVIGVDPGQGMIDAARSTLQDDPSALLGDATSESNSNKLADIIEYRKGSAEDLDWIPDESIDLVTAGQAAHWFDHDRVYPQLLRILKPGGTVAYWGYGYLFLPDYPQVTPKIMQFGQGTLGDYWEPGRVGPESLYDLVPFPKAESGWDTSSFKRQRFDEAGPSDACPVYETKTQDGVPRERFPISMRKVMDFEGLRQQLRTWSSAHTYMEKHRPNKHVVDGFMESLEADLPANGDITVEWPLGLLLMKKGQNQP